MSPNPVQFIVGYLANDSIFHLKELLTQVHSRRQVRKQFFQTEYSILGQIPNDKLHYNNMAKFIDYQILANTLVLKLNENTNVIFPVGIP